MQHQKSQEINCQQFHIQTNHFLNCIYNLIMEKLIPLISDIHDIIRKSEASIVIDLPIIAVVGSQSTGKSSLLEAIIGKEFLPRGRGIVTRRPIEIQLVNSNVQTEYVQFTDRKGEKIESFQDVRKTIAQETQKVCGSNKNISSIPIKVKIFSPNVVDLLLVDLPGIVKNPSEGQPLDIQQQVLNMIKQYIKNENCLIMAVSKATDDIANSESLKLARTVDPQGLRTIGILTQMDLVDESIDIIKDFNKLATPLKLGYVGVYLRPTKKSDEISLNDQYKQEEQYFKNHQLYHKYTGEIGVKYLIKTLNTNFIKHIKKTLPSIREKILGMLEIKQEQLVAYGKYQSITDKKDQGIFLLDSLQRFIRSYADLIEGKSVDNLDQLVGGARIQYIFSTIFNDSVLMMDPFEYLNDADLRVAIRNASGLRKSLFVAQVAFESLIKQQISRMLMPSLQCADLVHQELKRLLFLINIKEMERFQKLYLRVFSVMQDLLKRCLVKTQQMIRNIIQIEMGYINNNHPDFITTLSNVKNQSKKNLDSDTSSKMDYQVQYKQMVKKPKTKGISEVQLYNSKLFEQIPSRETHLTEDLKINGLQKYSSKHYNYFPRYPLPPVPEKITMNAKPKARQQTETDLIKRLIVSYFNVVKKNINDLVPKSIVTFLINQSKNSCQKVLVSSLYKQSDFDQLLVENQQLLKKREQIKKTIITLKTCLNQINKVSGRFS